MSETEASDTSCCPAQQPLNLSALSKDELKGEVERLHAELAETTQQKLQAAQYGLDVLEEKQSLQHQYEDLESLYDATKNELECAKAVCIFSFSFLRIFVMCLQC